MVGSSAEEERARLVVPLPHHIEAPKVAREYVTIVLKASGLDALIDEAALITSELATNAVRHTTGAFRLIVALFDTGVRLAIEDNSPLFPVFLPAELDDLGGRGMHLIDMMSKEWGVTPNTSGKKVWAVVAQ